MHYNHRTTIPLRPHPFGPPHPTMPNDLDTISPILADHADLSYENALHIHESQINPNASFTETLVLTTLDTLLGLAVYESDYLQALAHTRSRASDVGFADPAAISLFAQEHPLTPHDPIT